jgi:uncharacterized membrane protein YjgN (DUF898 family)
MAEALVTDPSPPPSSAYPPEPLRFTGTARAYFGIWIVNLLLTVITLGIYSPWAKVRRLHYFYRHTEVAGSSFDFHGSPIRILIGRAIAVAMFLTYNIAVRLKSPLTFVLIVLFAAILPWLLRNSLRFKLYNTSWRGTRFHFRGSVAGAYRTILLNGFFALITLYGLAPFAHQRLKAYQHNNSWFGTTPCSFHGRVRQFYLIYLLVLAAIVLYVVLFISSGIITLLASMNAPKPAHPPNPRAILTAVGILYAGVIFLGVSIWPAFTALIGNLVWSNTRIGAHRIECRMSPFAVIWIAVSNLAVVVLSLGFMVPWAMVRWTRYRIESVRLLLADDLQAVTAGDAENVGALGEEAVSLFDLDISL